MRVIVRHISCLLIAAWTAGCGSSQSSQGPPATVQLQEVQGQAPAGTIEIQGVSAGDFNPTYWVGNTLNWVPNVRVPMFAPLQTGPWQNVYSPWPLEQANGWLLFYGGWDGTQTPNDRVYNVPTPDFLSFGNRQLVIDHGAFEHVNNVNVQQLSDGSMHMICTVLPDQNGQDKPGYFSSPDGVTWNGSPEPYQAQASDIISIPNDPIFPTSDYNGGNVLLRENGAWTLYYSDGLFGGTQGAVYRATTTVLPVFNMTGATLSTSHYSNDVKKFQAGGATWYLMALYSEGLDVTNTVVWYSLSPDGTRFGQEQTMFSGATAQDRYLVTPVFVTRGSQILGVLYGGDAGGDCCHGQIFARWLQEKVVITDSAGVPHLPQGSYGPDRQWFQAPASGSLQGTITAYAEDGTTKLGTGPVNLAAGKVYRLVLP